MALQNIESEQLHDTHETRRYSDNWGLSPRKNGTGNSREKNNREVEEMFKRKYGINYDELSATTKQ